MAFDLNVKCSGELHRLRFEDDGSVTVDPEAHDVELEAALVELGGEASKCHLRAKIYREDPVRIVNQLGFVLGWEMSPSYVGWARNYAGIHLCTDSIVRACRIYNPTYAASRFALRAVERVRAAYPFLPRPSPLPENLDVDERNVLEHYAKDALDMKQRFEMRTPPHELLVATQALCWYAVRNQYAEVMVAKVTVAAAHVRAFVNALPFSEEKYIGQGSEVRQQEIRKETMWQARQAIRGVARLTEGEPWPSVS
jgi:hypothetical protein